MFSVAPLLDGRKDARAFIAGMAAKEDITVIPCPNGAGWLMRGDVLDGNRDDVWFRSRSAAERHAAFCRRMRKSGAKA